MYLLQLEYFKLLAEQQHVSKTAYMLHISQPSLSATIKKLEDELGCRLFDRSGRGIKLSECGQVFLKYVDSALSSIERGKNELTRIKERNGNLLSIGMLSPYIWKSAIYQFSSAYPCMNIKQISCEGYSFTEYLISGEIDFYIGATNGLDDNRIATMQLYSDDMAILMERTNPLSVKKTLELSECADQRFVMLPKSTSLQHFIDSICMKAELKPQVALECDYTLRDEMVASGYGISITTMRSAKYCKNPDVTYARLINPPDKRILSLAWNKLLPFTEAMNKFMQFICKFYSNMDGIDDNA